MKSLYLRSCVAIACAIGLIACGGSNGTLVLSGAVVGLNKTGLVVQNNGGPDLAVASGVTLFQFQELIGTDTDFDITIKTQPAGAVCTVINGKGKSGLYSPNNIAITCITNSYRLGGSITNLKGIGLALANGADLVTPDANATSFVFPRNVEDGAPYGVTVLHQPLGQTCTVANASGVVATTERMDVVVSCI